MTDRGKSGVYIHIPFCSGKCYYCDFYSAPASPETINAYAAALRRHILDTKGKPEADTVYFGGGTPSIIGADNLIFILDAVREAFTLDESPQITLEANPGDICLRAGETGGASDALKKLREAGFDRISFGVQSSCERELRMLGRRHSFIEAAQAVKTAKDTGFSDISLDLMYALPYQNMETWEKSIEDIVSLEPTHISCYALKLEKSSSLNMLSEYIPDEDAQLSMYLAMVERLAEKGYIQYEISNFAQAGFHSRHNVKYWTGADYYGFGPSAHSLVSGVRYAWHDDTAAYIRGEHEYKEYSRLDSRDRTEELLMLSLRTTAGIDLELFEAETGLDSRKFKKILDKYTAPGYAVREGARYSLTPRGMFVSDYIISELFSAIDERNI